MTLSSGAASSSYQRSTAFEDSWNWSEKDKMTTPSDLTPAHYQPRHQTYGYSTQNTYSGMERSMPTRDYDGGRNSFERGDLNRTGAYGGFDHTHGDSLPSGPRGRYASKEFNNNRYDDRRARSPPRRPGFDRYPSGPWAGRRNLKTHRPIATSRDMPPAPDEPRNEKACFNCGADGFDKHDAIECPHPIDYEYQAKWLAYNAAHWDRVRDYRLNYWHNEPLPADHGIYPPRPRRREFPIKQEAMDIDSIKAENDADVKWINPADLAPTTSGTSDCASSEASSCTLVSPIKIDRSSHMRSHEPPSEVSEEHISSVPDLSAHNGATDDPSSDTAMRDTSDADVVLSVSAPAARTSLSSDHKVKAEPSATVAGITATNHAPSIEPMLIEPSDQLEMSISMADDLDRLDALAREHKNAVLAPSDTPPTTVKAESAELTPSGRGEAIAASVIVKNETSEAGDSLSTYSADLPAICVLPPTPLPTLQPLPDATPLPATQPSATLSVPPRSPTRRNPSHATSPRPDQANLPVSAAPSAPSKAKQVRPLPMTNWELKPSTHPTKRGFTMNDTPTLRSIKRCVDALNRLARPAKEDPRFQEHWITGDMDKIAMRLRDGFVIKLHGGDSWEARGFNLETLTKEGVLRNAACKDKKFEFINMAKLAARFGMKDDADDNGIHDTHDFAQFFAEAENVNIRKNLLDCYYEAYNWPPQLRPLQSRTLRSYIGEYPDKSMGMELSELSEETWFIASHALSWTGGHHDAGGRYTYIHVLLGEKRWYYVRLKPETLERMKTEPEEVALDLISYDTERMSRAADFYYVPLEPGNSLLQPSWTKHYVWTTEDSFMAGKLFDLPSFERMEMCMREEHVCGETSTNANRHGWYSALLNFAVTLPTVKPDRNMLPDDDLRALHRMLLNPRAYVAQDEQWGQKMDLNLSLVVEEALRCRKTVPAKATEMRALSLRKFRRFSSEPGLHELHDLRVKLLLKAIPALEDLFRERELEVPVVQMVPYGSAAP